MANNEVMNFRLYKGAMFNGYKFYGFISNNENGDPIAVAEGTIKLEAILQFWDSRPKSKEQKNAMPFDVWQNLSGAANSAEWLIALKDEEAICSFKELAQK